MIAEASSHKRPESVLVVVYSADSQVLMLRRHEPPTFWQSVTGSLEWGEQPEQAARRELVEETGLDATALEDCHDSHLFEIYEIWRHRYAEGVTENREHVFRMAVPEVCPVTLDALEHSEYEWLPGWRRLSVRLLTRIGKQSWTGFRSDRLRVYHRRRL